MTHQVVRLADQFVVGKTADRDEGVIAVGDAAIEVRGGDQALLVGKGSFVLSDGQVHAHLERSFEGGIEGQRN